MNPWLWLPLGGAAVGAATNAATLALLLLPRRELRCGRLRWQGLLPAQAAGLGRAFSVAAVAGGVDLKALLGLMEPAEVTAAALAQLGTGADGLLERALRSINPGLWDQLRPPVRALWISRMRPTMPAVIEQLLRALQQQPERHVDLPELVAEQLGEQPALLVELVRAIGGRVGALLVAASALAGAVLGLVAAALWQIQAGAPAAIAWLAAIGAATNAIAWSTLLPVRRERRQPVTPPGRAGPGGVIGRWHAAAVAHAASAMIEQWVTFGAMIAHLARRGDSFRRLCADAIQAQVHSTAGGSAPMLGFALGAESVETAIDAMAASIAASAPQLMAQVQLPETTRRAMTAMLARQLQPLPLEVFAGAALPLLRPYAPRLLSPGILFGSVAGALVGLL